MNVYMFQYNLFSLFFFLLHYKSMLFITVNLDISIKFSKTFLHPLYFVAAAENFTRCTFLSLLADNNVILSFSPFVFEPGPGKYDYCILLYCDLVKIHRHLYLDQFKL